MIVGLGVDVVELDRVQAAHKKFARRFERRILTLEEASVMPSNPVAFLASRFAAKEAAVKALGTGFSSGITLHHIQIQKDPSGQVHVCFTGPARARFEALGAHRAHLSLSHGRNTAVAVVVLERLDKQYHLAGE